MRGSDAWLVVEQDAGGLNQSPEDNEGGRKVISGCIQPPIGSEIITVCTSSSLCRLEGARACVLTLSDPDSEDTEEEEECCWGLEMDMGESALCGDTESLCCSSDPTPVLTTQGTCSDTSGFGGETTNAEGPEIYVRPAFHGAV